jgi:hypothetical protein
MKIKRIVRVFVLIKKDRSLSEKIQQNHEQKKQRFFETDKQEKEGTARGTQQIPKVSDGNVNVDVFERRKMFHCSRKDAHETFQ